PAELLPHDAGRIRPSAGDAVRGQLVCRGLSPRRHVRAAHGAIGGSPGGPVLEWRCKFVLEFVVESACAAPGARHAEQSSGDLLMQYGKRVFKWLAAAALVGATAATPVLAQTS